MTSTAPATTREASRSFLLAGTLLAERLLDKLVLAAWLFAGALVLGIGGPLLLAGIALSGGSALGVLLAAVAAARPAALERLVGHPAQSPRPRRTSQPASRLFGTAARSRSPSAPPPASGSRTSSSTPPLGWPRPRRRTGRLPRARGGRQPRPSRARNGRGHGSFDYVTLMAAKIARDPRGGGRCLRARRARAHGRSGYRPRPSPAQPRGSRPAACPRDRAGMSRDSRGRSPGRPAVTLGDRPRASYATRTEASWKRSLRRRDRHRSRASARVSPALYTIATR